MPKKLITIFLNFCLGGDIWELTFTNFTVIFKSPVLKSVCKILALLLQNWGCAFFNVQKMHIYWIPPKRSEWSEGEFRFFNRAWAGKKCLSVLSLSLPQENVDTSPAILTIVILPTMIWLLWWFAYCHFDYCHFAY